MTVSAKKRAELIDRRRKVAKLYLRKMSQEDIAKKLGVSQSTVSRDIRYLTKKWTQEAIGDIDRRRGRELAELEEIEYDCAAQFASNKEPAWLRIRLRAKERIARMLGLDAPTGIDLTSKGEKLDPNVIVVRDYLAAQEAQETAENVDGE